MQLAASTQTDVARRTRRRVDRRLMPFILLLYIVSYLDRFNVSLAGLQMSKELGFSDSVFGLGSGIFFIGYFLLEIPGGVLAEVWSARKWIARILLTWGFLASATGFIHTAQQFYWARFFLGVAEAGFVPGILVYLSHWYRPEDRGKAIAIFFAGIPASQALGGPLAAVLLRIHWLGLAGWRWLLILEGIPAVVLGIITLFYLTERPQKAKWLQPDEREWLAGELEKEQASKTERISAWRALADPRVLLLAAILFLGLNSNYGVSLWLPQMVQRLSTFDVSKVSLIASIPSLCSLPLMLLVGWHSDRSGERIWHTVIPRLLSAASLIVVFFSTVSGHIWLSVAMLSLATIGFYCAHPAFWPLPNVFLGRAAAAASLGLINSFGNLGGFLGPYMLGALSDRTGGFGPGLLYLAGCSLTSGLLVLVVGSVAGLKRRTRSS
ncbi:MAG: MFS transporter [Bryobacterales bacterium]|nr:MFS transporter [Bryobacterales bacterium]